MKPFQPEKCQKCIEKSPQNSHEQKMFIIAWNFLETPFEEFSCLVPALQRSIIRMYIKIFFLHSNILENIKTSFESGFMIKFLYYNSSFIFIFNSEAIKSKTHLVYFSLFNQRPDKLLQIVSLYTSSCLLLSYGALMSARSFNLFFSSKIFFFWNFIFICRHYF